jgi:soluble lytic murein transglycosylase-like protein
MHFRSYLVAVLAAFFVFVCVKAHAQESAGQYWAKERGQSVFSTSYEAAKAGWHRRQRGSMLASAPASGIHGIVTAAAQRNGVPVALMHGVIRAESNYRCNAYNRAGKAIGIGQVKAATGRSVGVHGSLYDCRNGAEAAARYLRLAIARGGAGCAGVSLYERGVFARPVCTGYGRRVMALARI